MYNELPVLLLAEIQRLTRVVDEQQRQIEELRRSRE